MGDKIMLKHTKPMVKAIPLQREIKKTRQSCTRAGMLLTHAARSAVFWCAEGSSKAWVRVVFALGASVERGRCPSLEQQISFLRA